MAMKQTLFYFMSGTGNSYRMCKEAAAVVTAAAIPNKIIPLEKAKFKTDFNPGRETLFGLFYPTHGFTAPWPVIKAALLLPFGKGTQVMLSACRAGWMIGPWHLPGLEGTATLLIAIIVWLKGYDVKGFTAIDMPSNWLAVHWGLKKENAEWFRSRGAEKIKNYTAVILSGNRKYTGFVFILIGILLAQISLMYLIVARLMLAKIMYADYNCNSCGICWNNCPYHAIKPVGRKNKTPYWTFNCESCERCIAYCPQKAIQTGFLYLLLLNLIMYGVIAFVPLYLMNLSAQFLPFGSNPFYIQVLNIAYAILCVFLGYFFLIYPARIKPVNYLWTFTTPTKVFRRYNEPTVTLKDLKGE
jgi:ferredoxin